jgi:hypothetical protein
MYKFPKAPRWLTPIKDIHSNWHKDNEERKSRASIVIQAESISNISSHQTQPSQLPTTQTSPPHSLFSDAVVPLVGILILTKAPSALHACSMAITQPDAQHQTRLGANFVLKITIPHSINVLIQAALIKQENLVTIFHPYATTVNYRTNLVPQCSVRQEQFLLMRKRRQDAFEARQARRNAIPTPLILNNIYG